MYDAFEGLGVPFEIIPPVPGHYYKLTSTTLLGGFYSGKLEKIDKDYYFSDFKFGFLPDDNHPLKQDRKITVVPAHFIKSEGWLYEYTPTLLPEVSKITKDLCRTCYRPGNFVRMALMCEEHGLIGGC